MVLMNLSLGQQWTLRQSRLVDTGRERGTNWRTNVEIYTLEYVEYLASGNLLYDSGISDLVLCPSRWLRLGGRWERDSRGREHMYTYGWFMLVHGRNWQYYKAIILQLKNSLKYCLFCMIWLLLFLLSFDFHLHVIFFFPCPYFQSVCVPRSEVGFL